MIKFSTKMAEFCNIFVTIFSVFMLAARCHSYSNLSIMSGPSGYKQFKSVRVKLADEALSIQELSQKGSEAIRLNRPRRSAQTSVKEPAGMFVDVVNKKSFVDKSEMIKLVSEASLMQFLQAPPGFGKSTALNMIKLFFEINVDKLGEIILPKSKTPNYNLFKRTPAFLGRQLNIFRDKGFMVRHFGQYPVVLLDFKKIKPVSFSEKELAEGLHNAIRLAFLEHEYLISSKKCIYRKALKSILIHSEPLSNMKSVIGYMNRFLDCLTTHHKKQVLVLIDEVDSPIRKILFSSKGIDTEEFSNSFASFVQNICKDNTLVRSAFMTGVISYAEGHPWGANNIKRKSIFLDKEYSPYYGLYEAEVRSLCERYGNPEMYSKIEEWFNGYTVAESKCKLFNTISVIDSLERNNITTSWAASGFVGDILNALRFGSAGKEIRKLLQDQSLMIEVGAIGNLKMKSLKIAIDANKLATEKAIALQILFEHGFFTLSDAKLLANQSSVFSARIPNKEVEQVLSSSF